MLVCVIEWISNNSGIEHNALYIPNAAHCPISKTVENLQVCLFFLSLSLFFFPFLLSSLPFIGSTPSMGLELKTWAEIKSWMFRGVWVAQLLCVCLRLRSWDWAPHEAPHLVGSLPLFSHSLYLYSLSSCICLSFSMSNKIFKKRRVRSTWVAKWVKPLPSA